MNPQKNRKRKNNKGRGARSSKIVALLVLFCLCIGGISMVSAKYIKQNDTKNNSATAKEFYFESDLLDGKEHEVVATNDAGGNATASVTVRLKNYADKLRYSETEILYAVSVTEEGSTDSATGVTIEYPANTASSENGLYKISAGQKQDADVTLSNLQEGKTYLVTATTNNIYQKTLTGMIKVSQPDTNVYASISNDNASSPYIEVTVWTTDYTGKVTLNYDQNIGLIPDNTDPKMQGKSTAEAITENNWTANTSHVFRFFKEDTAKSYKVETRVTENGAEVTVSEK